MIRITTKRLYLELPPPETAAEVAAFQRANRSFLAQHEPPRPSSYYSDEYWYERLRDLAEAVKLDKQYPFFVYKKGEPEQIIGWVNFANIVRGAFQACHLGYNLSQGFEGHGYMTEALEAAIPYMFTEKNFHRIMANYVPTNHGSARVLAKLGFQKEGVAKDYLFLGGVWRDHILTSLINPAWQLEPRAT